MDLVKVITSHELDVHSGPSARSVRSPENGAVGTFVEDGSRGRLERDWVSSDTIDHSGENECGGCEHGWLIDYSRKLEQL